MELPLLAITLGDPAGVGPETIVGAWSDPRVHQVCRPLVVGRPAILRRAAELLGNRVRVVEIEAAENGVPSPALLPCLACGSADAEQVKPGAIDPRGGQAAYDALLAAARLAMDERVAAIVTAPLHKAALHAAGHNYPGHTELLAELTGVRDFAMMLYLAPGGPIQGPSGLGVVHVTLHVALRDVFRNLSTEAILSKARLADIVMRALASSSQKNKPPRIGVCALNPHASDQGLFGDEEATIIEPAVQQGRAAGLNLTGPLPTDSLFVRAAAGEFDGVVAMYHDQGHIALKLLGMHRAVNITLGLPIVRTSVAHGTAFDLAWKGQAETSSMVEAIRVAAELSRSREQLRWAQT